MKRLKLTATLVLVAALLTIASPAQACACSEYGTAQDFVAWFNSQPYEVRAYANVLPPLGSAWSTDYYMVPMNLCGQTEVCF